MSCDLQMNALFMRGAAFPYSPLNDWAYFKCGCRCIACQDRWHYQRSACFVSAVAIRPSNACTCTDYNCWADANPNLAHSPPPHLDNIPPGLLGNSANPHPATFAGSVVAAKRAYHGLVVPDVAELYKPHTMPASMAEEKLPPMTCAAKDCGFYNEYVGKEHLIDGVYVCRQCRPSWERKKRTEELKKQNDENAKKAEEAPYGTPLGHYQSIRF